ncbi:MAG: antibiotic biosynthesis monooxygenase [Dehalococcoidia bacterium]|nr:antibiotic biosynthesis monooxygenase [Dehalococcoidia bacterium]MDH4299425.1 antibiotic biosynthesis monooxygenase [Dehalococcoidia bacterium]MDH4368062.1 antibiotic biosynthesis monooxygenase [Dehalococcoidia bacterium]
MQAIVKKEGMIKGIIGYKVLDYKSVEQILMQLKSAAMQYPGYVDAEFLVSEGDQSIGLMISTWETMENWRTWVESKGTEALLRRARTAVMGSARLSAYKMMPTVEWR